MTTLFIGQTTIRLNEVHSTNAYAMTLLKSNAVIEGTVIMAHSQTSGRGQRGNSWHSEPGKNLTISIILLPDFIDTNKQFDLNKAVASGIVDFISEYTGREKKVSIKWPNDIYVDDKKIAGILIENNLRNGRLYSSVIGIGCNINQVEFEPSVPNPTSLKIETGKDHDIENCLKRLCSCIEGKYIELRGTGSGKIKEHYNSLLYKKNSVQRFMQANGEELRGEIAGVEDNGFLKIKMPDGEVKLFSNTGIAMIIPV